MSKSKNIEVGKNVIKIEAQAVAAIANRIGNEFDKAVNTILNCKGRLIILGMGKSGLISQKIASTMASTGTPSHFVHPADAFHGDLGMIVKGDIIIILSNSGETPELANLVAYSKKFEIPMIGIAQNKNSTLLQKTNVSIVLPEAKEACESGIVPTTSTTMTLALGDALSITLMEHRNFTPSNFREFHPGGNLGAQLSRVKDIMHTNDLLPLTDLNTPMDKVLINMSKKGFGIVGVLDKQDNLLGIITDGDLRRNMDTLLDMNAKEVMTINPQVIESKSLLVEALKIMNSRKITCLFVVEENKPIGIIHIHDCLRAGIKQK